MTFSLVVWLTLLLSASCIIRMPLAEVALKPSQVYGHRQAMIRQGIYDDANGMYLMTKLELGEDRQEVPLIIDSGSPTLWINRYECGNDPIGLLGDCRLATQPVSLGYLDGLIHGKLTHTSVWLNSGQVKSPGHELVVIDQKTRLMTYGIIGLSKGYGDETTFLTTLKNNKLIQEEAFAIYCKDDHLELILGGVDRSLVKQNSKEATVTMEDESAYFMILDDSKIGDTLISGEPSIALIDSGNTLISFPGYLAKTVLNTLAEKGFDCMLFEEQNPLFNILGCALEYGQPFPDFTFIIKGVPFTISGTSLVHYCVEDEESDSGAYYTGEGIACYMKIEFHMTGDYFTLGKAFIQKVYTTFNLDKKTLTFVQNLD